MSKLLHAVMCGGSGTRLWPWSRRSYPKQFLSLVGDMSLLQATVKRLDGEVEATSVVAFGHEEHRFLIAEHLRLAGVGSAGIVLEPEARGTAPVALVAALLAESRLGNDCVVILSPADHHVADPAAFRTAVGKGIAAARAGRVATLGMTPKRPETDYGYIEAGSEIEGLSATREVLTFHEKPDPATAREYCERGSFLWNAGIFLFCPQTVIELAAALEPKMLEACQRAFKGATVDLGFLRLDREPYRSLEPASFDTAFAERMGENGAVVQTEVGWSDIGSWQSLHEVLSTREASANVLRGPVEASDCSGTLVASDGPLVVSHGMRNTVVVASHDAVFVAPADRSQEVKEIVAALEKRSMREASTHIRTYRPWGWYQTIDSGPRFHVKEIVVQPGGRLSLQAHYHRAEHWVVVRGTAKVTVNEAETIVAENESIFIPLGARHRLENPGYIPVHLIEVQTGSYLEEDDIVRFDDQYGRA